jgi:hypothetical protein
VCCVCVCVCVCAVLYAQSPTGTFEERAVIEWVTWYRRTIRTFKHILGASDTYDETSTCPPLEATAAAAVKVLVTLFSFFYLLLLLLLVVVVTVIVIVVPASTHVDGTSMIKGSAHASTHAHSSPSAQSPRKPSMEYPHDSPTVRTSTAWHIER